MPASIIPSAKAIKVDTRGAVILQEESPETRDSRGIYLPNHIEPVSHIAVDIGGSLAKVIYFTRSPVPPASSESIASSPLTSSTDSLPTTPDDDDTGRGSLPSRAKLTGALTPLILESSSRLLTTLTSSQDAADPSSSSNTTSLKTAPPNTSNPDPGQLRGALLRRASTTNFPGGSLNFERFETEHIDECVEFIQHLIERSAKVNHVSSEQMRKSVKIMATGGGAHKFYDLFRETLGVEVRREDEMECLIEGLRFITCIPNEAYSFSDELIDSVSHGSSTSTFNPQDLERPSPNPPQYSVSFETDPTPQLPCLLVNIGSGVSIIKVDEDGKFERVSGTSLGGGTLWGLLSLLTPATSFDEMLALSEKGDNATVDMLVSDIYGQETGRLGLKSTVIASSFGKVFKKGSQKREFRPEDISRSLLYGVSNNIGQIAYMNAEKYGLERIYFGGCFIRGHAATISTLSYAIRFWSKGTKRAMFLRHEGFLGSIGAWIKNMEPSSEESPQNDSDEPPEYQSLPSLATEQGLDCSV